MDDGGTEDKIRRVMLEGGMVILSPARMLSKFFMVICLFVYKQEGLFQQEKKEEQIKFAQTFK